MTSHTYVVVMLCCSVSSLPDKCTASSQTDGIVTIINIGNPSGNAQSRHDVTMLAKSSLATLPHSKNASTSTREINFPTFPKSVSSSRVSVTNMGTVMTLPSSTHVISMVPSVTSPPAHSSLGSHVIGANNVSIIHTGTSIARPPSATIMTTASRHPRYMYSTIV